MKNVDLSKYNNDWYKKEIGASRMKQAAWYFINIIFLKNRFNPFSSSRVFFLRLFGASVGKGVRIKPGVNVKYPWKLNVGDFCWIGENVWIDNLAPVAMGNNVCVSQGAMLLTGNHDFSKPQFDLKVAPIDLEDGAWIGAQSVVCPGVKVLSHAVLAVKSVATSDLQPFSIYQGNPAMKVKERVIG
jgi:putative colanic acid biosynthesis acetyltransferase WcaF